MTLKGLNVKVTEIITRQDGKVIGNVNQKKMIDKFVKQMKFEAEPEEKTRKFELYVIVLF